MFESHTVFPHANLANNAKSRSYEYVSHGSHKSHEMGCIAKSARSLSALPSVYIPEAGASKAMRPFREICEIRVRLKSVLKDFAPFASKTNKGTVPL